MTTEQLASTVSEFTVSLPGAEMPVIRFGSGARVLVIIAGMSLSGLKGQGQGVAAAYADFAEDYTVYLFDRRDNLPEGFTVQDMADDVAATLTTLGVTKADFYGCSQGGMIGLCLAIHHKQLVRSLALCSSTSRAGDAMRATMLKWKALGQQADVVAINRCFFDMVYSPAYLQGFAALLPTLEKQGTPADCRRFSVLAQACADFDVFDQLPAIACPLLLMADSNDRVIPVQHSLEIAEKLHCQLEVYTQYSHALYDEAPQVKQRLLDFIKAQA